MIQAKPLGVAIVTATLACGSDSFTGPVSIDAVDYRMTESGVHELDVASEFDDATLWFIDDAGHIGIQPTLRDGQLVADDARDGFYTAVLNRPGRPTQGIVTFERDLDVGESRTGRRDAAFGDADAELAIDVDGLASGGTLGLYSPGARLRKDVGLADGQTTATVSFDGAPLIEGDRGDRLYVAQWDIRNVDGFQYRHAVRWLESAAIDMTDPARRALRGTFVETTPETLSLELDTQGFKALVTAARGSGDTPLPDRVVALVFVNPSEQFLGTVSLPIALLLNNGGDQLDVELPYADPAPRDWAREWWVAVTVLVNDLTLPGTLRGGLKIAMSHARSGARPWDGRTVTPELSGPRDLRINGIAATTDIDGIGTTPTPTWAAPELGVPTYYEVSVYRGAVAGDETAFELAANIRTAEQFLVMPPGILAPSQAYVFVVWAIAEPNSDPRAPFRYTLPYDTAAAVSPLAFP